MMEKLLRMSWGTIAVAILLSATVSAREVTRLENLNSGSNQPGENMQTLKSYLDDVGKYYNVSIGYDASLVDQVFVSKKEKFTDDINKDLKKGLKQTGLKYERIKKDHYVIITKRNKSGLKELKKASLNAPEQEFSALLASQSKAIASIDQVYEFQDRTITGTVISTDNNEPLPGVNIVIKGTTVGGITDLDGKYTIEVPDDAISLIVSSVGYETIEVEIGNQSVIDVNLVPDVTSLSEVIVVGYGTQDKRDVTAAIASLDEESIRKTLYRISQDDIPSSWRDAFNLKTSNETNEFTHI